jgi:ABC-2 type transport system ATP-binding protein
VGPIDVAIETSGLSKRFRRRVAVQPLDLSVPAGSLFGYLGPNGAGKTTTIRMLLGLARPTSGSSRVLGQDVPHGLATVRKHLGCVLENPAFYPKLSARENLLLLARLSGDDAARRRIDPLLERLGLADRARDKVKTYSHGMRQRLGLAAALLHDPALIVLDEPATALDPAGIRDVRALLASLRDEGKTIFLSSHLLSEVEQICDRVCVVSKGSMMYQGTLAGLTVGGAFVRVAIDDVTAALEAMTSMGWNVQRDGETAIVHDVPAKEVNRALATRNLYAHGISTESRKLEDVFLELTEAPDADAPVEGSDA